ncbi:MAG TPA: phosphohistidine phosphatase SixA [Gammaproteobacteria bacterium]|nr:phosphohistidine phosphatase SixA [Gammaproteobacteria bacterium]
MKLVLIRHGRAEERRLLQRDHTRALTADGRRRVRKASRGLRATVPGITHIATSPLMRARQTADVIATEYADAERHVCPGLAPGSAPRGVVQWLRQLPAEATVAMIGHEPDLGRLAGYLLTGRPAALLQFKKGAAALLEFSSVPRAGSATLDWFLTAAQLGKLA